jgi:hypothetical protein
MSSLREECKTLESHNVVALAILAYKYDLLTQWLVRDYCKFDCTGKYEAVFIRYDTKERYMVVWEDGYDLPLASRFESPCGTYKVFTG